VADEGEEVVQRAIREERVALHGEVGRIDLQYVAARHDGLVRALVQAQRERRLMASRRLPAWATAEEPPSTHAQPATKGTWRRAAAAESLGGSKKAISPTKVSSLSSATP
jgi:hypothetical protein